MRWTRVVAVAMMLGMLVLVGFEVASQDKSKATDDSEGTTEVAVVDVALCLEKCSRFQEKGAELRRETEENDAEARKIQQEARKRVEDIQNYAPGTDKYKQAAEENVKWQSEKDAEFRIKKNDIAERQAKAIFDAYREIEKEVARVATDYRISVVLTYDSRDYTAQMDPRMYVNRAVIFQSKRDITNEVLTGLNKGKKSGPNSTTKPPVDVTTNPNGGKIKNKPR